MRPNATLVRVDLRASSYGDKPAMRLDMFSGKCIGTFEGSGNSAFNNKVFEELAANSMALREDGTCDFGTGYMGAIGRLLAVFDTVCLCFDLGDDTPVKLETFAMLNGNGYDLYVEETGTDGKLSHGQWKAYAPTLTDGLTLESQALRGAGFEVQSVDRSVCATVNLGHDLTAIAIAIAKLYPTPQL